MKTATYIRITSGKVEVSSMENPVEPIDTEYRKTDDLNGFLMAKEMYRRNIKAFNDSFVEVHENFLGQDSVYWWIETTMGKAKFTKQDGLYPAPEGMTYELKYFSLDMHDKVKDEISESDVKDFMKSFGDDGKQDLRMKTYFKTVATVSFQDHKPQEEPKELQPDFVQLAKDAGYGNDPAIHYAAGYQAGYNALQQKIEALEEEVKSLKEERDRMKPFIEALIENTECAARDEGIYFADSIRWDDHRTEWFDKMIDEYKTKQ